MAGKTNAARILDNLGIPYSIENFEVDLDNLSAVHIAEKLKISAHHIYKTLVLSGNISSYFVTIIPADAQLDLKKVAKVSGNKHCELIPMKDLFKITGYIRGGCAPLGMKKQFPTYIHNEIIGKNEIRVSAGKRGKLLVLNPDDLISASRAIPADLIRI